MNKSLKMKAEPFDYVLLLLFAGVVFITLYPFLNVLAVSFNDPTDTMRDVNMVIPRKFTLYNYQYIFREENLAGPLLMSILRTVVGTVSSLLCNAMLAYALSRSDFFFKKAFTAFFVVTMYVSGGLIPSYLLICRDLHMNNSFWVYIIPALISTYNMILIRSYIEGMPKGLEEAARIDGASDFTIFWRIILPLCKPVLATVALFIAVGQWNSFMDTYLYAKDLPTLQYILYKIMQQATMKIDTHSTNIQQLTNAVSPLSVRMAVTVIATMPIIIIYPFLQKYFVGGMTLGAVKE